MQDLKPQSTHTYCMHCAHTHSALPLVQAALGISDFSAALGISDFSAALGIGAGQRWAALGSVGQRWAALGSAGQRWAALGPWQRWAALRRQRCWAALLVLAAVSSAGHFSAARRWAALGLWQRWAALRHGQRWAGCLALGSAAGQRWAALPSAAQRYFRYVDSGTDPLQAGEICDLPDKCIIIYTRFCTCRFPAPVMHRNVL